MINDVFSAKKCGIDLRQIICLLDEKCGMGLWKMRHGLAGNNLSSRRKCGIDSQNIMCLRGEEGGIDSRKQMCLHENAIAQMQALHFYCLSQNGSSH